jgi:hypothetical protein
MKDKWHYVALFAAYSCSWWLLLLNYNGLYWDGIGVWERSPQEFIELYVMQGNPLFAVYHVLVTNMGNGIFPYRFFSFINTFISGACFYYLIKNSRFVNRNSAFLIALLALIFPVFQARVTISVSIYPMFVALFFVATVLMVIAQKKTSIILRFVSLALFFVSFTLNSLIFFYGIALLYMAYLDRALWRVQGIKNLSHKVSKWAFTKADYILLPIIFGIIKLLFFMPHGDFKTYNKVDLTGIVKAIPFSFYNLFPSFFEPIDYAFSFISSFVIIAAFGIGYGLQRYTSIQSRSLPPIKHVILLSVGLLLFVTGVYAYNAVWKTPNLYDWASRHQVLVPYGASILLFALLTMIITILKLKQYQFYLFGLVITVFIWSNNISMAEYLRDHMKQRAFIQHIQTLEDLKLGKHAAFFIEDNTKDINAMRRIYRTYDYSKMINTLAFGGKVGEPGILFSDNSYTPKDYLHQIEKHLNNPNNKSKPAVIGIIKIYPGSREIPTSIFDLFRLKMLELFRGQKYAQEIKDMIRVRYTPLTPPF